MMDAGRDFRRERMRGMRTWLVPADARADRELDRAFAELTGGAEGKPETLWVMGRKFVVPLAAEGVARFDFDTLCGAALGPGDYLALATRFHTLILDGIPRLSPDNYDKARRFIVLIDTLYDQRVKLIASADATPDQLYQRGENAQDVRAHGVATGRDAEPRLAGTAASGLTAARKAFSADIQRIHAKHADGPVRLIDCGPRV